MKVFILGIDGLEFNLVVEANLRNLIQKRYGEVILPPEVYITTFGEFGKFQTPYTPIVWASFLTGKLPNEHKVTSKSWRRWDSKILNRLKEFSIKLRLDKIKNKGKSLELLGFKRRTHTKEDYHCPTIFDLTEKYIQVNVPTVDREWNIRLLEKEEELDFQEVAKEWWKKYLLVKEKVLSLVEGEWNLFMAYTRILDVYGHLFWGNKEKMMRAYRDIDEFTGMLKNKVGERTVVLVISDHGMKIMDGAKIGGCHTDYGFYSVNKKINIENPKITDFYHLVESWLKE